MTTLWLGPWLLPHQRRQSRPGCKKTCPELSRLGAPWHCPLCIALSATFSTRSCTRRDTRRQSFPVASRGSEAREWQQVGPMSGRLNAARRTDLDERPPKKAPTCSSDTCVRSSDKDEGNQGQHLPVPPRGRWVGQTPPSPGRTPLVPS
jgi:hypothetical protein